MQEVQSIVAASNADKSVDMTESVVGAGKGKEFSVANSDSEAIDKIMKDQQEKGADATNQGKEVQEKPEMKDSQIDIKMAEIGEQDDVEMMVPEE